MKFTLSWLKEHLETSAGIDEITDRLTQIGLEVEGVENKARDLAPFRIAKVVTAEQHPNADRLRVCAVDPGDGITVQVVCGAPNARAGMKGVFAPAGTHIPGTGVDLKVGTIRGVESHGMLLSERELGLSDDHQGVVELPEDAPVGEPYAAWMKLDDPVIDIAVTPNRPDCLGVSGIARDLAAAGIGKLIKRPPMPATGGYRCPVDVVLDFGDSEPLCPAFGLRLIRGVKNGPSPDWLQQRLREIGLRPINKLVDITNFITVDRGRPLHVFDADRVRGDLVVRRAKSGERLPALDGKTYDLDETMCVIADQAGPESLAGIVGGEASGCTERTTNVLVESALWEPLNIARTGRQLGVNSDARFRFERGVDPAFMLPGLELATEMIVELCGGDPSEIATVGKVPEPRRNISFPVTEVVRLSGIDVPRSRVLSILGALGFDASGTSGQALSVVVPPWRPDVDGKADLVEEVVRIVGVDEIPATPMPRVEGVAAPVLTVGQRRTRLAKRVLAASGLAEAMTWSFISETEAAAFDGNPLLALANPISTDMSNMRPSLIPGLLAAAQRNADRGSSDVGLFEVGHIYRGDRPEDQLTAATGLRRGTAGLNGGGRHWSGNAASVSVYDAKSDLLTLLAALGAPVGRLQIVPKGPAWFHPGRVGTLQLGPKNRLAWFGELHPATLEILGVDGPVVAFEAIIEAIPEPKAKPTRTKPALEEMALQPVRRDFAFVVDPDIAAARIVKAAESASKRLITALEVFDVFQSDAIGVGKKSVAIEVTIQPREHTLTEAEIDEISKAIIASVTKATGATLRV
ncbi:MAG: phenylalanine--tRNA ligase subunit beta [Alphaproteobacteria bacterium]